MRVSKKFRIMRLSFALFCPCLWSFSSFGATANNVVAHITNIEPAPMPASFLIQIDQWVGNCVPNQTWLTYSNSTSDNVKALYAEALTAKASALPVDVYIQAATCTITNIHFGNN